MLRLATPTTSERWRFRGRAITGGGIPTSFVFFGYLTSSGGYVYGQAPSDNAGAFIGTSATYTQYFAIANTGNGTSTPPFSNEQPSGFSAAEKAAFKHDTFDPFYRSPAGAVTENTQVTLRFRTGHFDVDGVTVRAYLFDTASGNTTGPVDTSLAFDQNIVENSTTYDVWKAVRRCPRQPPSTTTNSEIFKGSTTRLLQRRLSDDNDNLNKDGTGAAIRRRAVRLVPDHGVRSEFPDARLAAKRQRVPDCA